MNMKSRWIDFEGKPNRTSKVEPRVTLDGKGVILLNYRACEAFNTPAAVSLHFDEHERVIGLKPVDARHRNAFPLKPKKKVTFRLISAAPFCRHFKIKINGTVVFNDLDIDNEGVMLLPLRSATSVGRGHW